MSWVVSDWAWTWPRRVSRASAAATWSLGMRSANVAPATAPPPEETDELSTYPRNSRAVRSKTWLETSCRRSGATPSVRADVRSTRRAAMLAAPEVTGGAVEAEPDELPLALRAEGGGLT